jgi:hypothetical protein
MKEKSTTHKAAGLGKTDQNRLTAQSIGSASVPQLTGEEKFLESVMEFARGLKCSADGEIARAAREWESKFDFRIRIEKQFRERRAKARSLRLQITPTSSRSGVRIRVGVSPNQD